MRAKKLLGSGESWRKQACFLTWASAVPQLSPLPHPPHGVAGPARPTHSGYFRYRVLCALGLVRREWAPVNICSPSPANHNRAPRGSEEATILPQGHSGKSGSQKQMGLFTETWSLGCTLRPRGQSSQGSSNQVSFICFTEYCTLSQRVSKGFSNLHSAVKLSGTSGLRHKT